MELNGRLTAKLAEQRGTSKAGKEWVKQDFVIETQDQYPKLVCINVIGEDKLKLIENIKIGELITCHINIQSNEFKGKYYTNVSAWKIELNERNSNSAPPIQATINNSFIEDNSNLPF